MRTGPQLTILIVDDHPILRKCVRLFLATQGRFTVCGEAESPEEGLILGRKLEPDIVILDLSIKGDISIEAIKSIKEALPTCKILVFTGLDEETFALRCIKSGASGYVQKGESLETLALALSRVAEGQIYLSPSLLTQVHADRDNLPVESLSDKEFEVFLLYGQGLATGEIAERLGRSYKTVQAHRENIKEKLRSRSAAEFRATAMKWYSDSLH